MLPLSHRDSSSILNRVKEKLFGWQRLIWSDKAVRNLFLFLLLNFSFAFVEFLYGFWTNSLGLISDSFHMFFDCTSLVAGLGASIIQKKKANEKFSYGYVRVETLMGFANSLFLIFIAVSIMTHAVERALEPPEVKHERLFLISILGLLVNLVGIYAFNHGHAEECSHGHSHGHHNHKHDGNSLNHHNYSHHHHHDIEIEHLHKNSGNSKIMKGVFLHILADTLGSVGVIISALLMQVFGWLIADPICSMFIAILIVVSVWSLLKESAEILMQRQPKELDDALPQCYIKVTQLAGVYSVQDQHFWTLSSNSYVGCIKLEVARTVDPRYVVAHTNMIFHAVGVKQLNIQLDYSSS